MRGRFPSAGIVSEARWHSSGIMLHGRRPAPLGASASLNLADAINVLPVFRHAAAFLGSVIHTEAIQAAHNRRK